MAEPRDADTDRLRDKFMWASTPGERFILLLDALEDLVRSSDTSPLQTK